MRKTIKNLDDYTHILLHRQEKSINLIVIRKDLDKKFSQNSVHSLVCPVMVTSAAGVVLRSQKSRVPYYITIKQTNCCTVYTVQNKINDYPIYPYTIVEPSISTYIHTQHIIIHKVSMV